MKRMPFPAVLAMLIIGYAQQTFTVGNKLTTVTLRETIIHHFFVSGIGQEKTVDAARICGGVENAVKTETQQTFVNGSLGFITFSIYTPLGTRVYCSQQLSIDMGSSFVLFINIFLGSLQLPLYSDKPPSEGGNNPVQRCLPVGGLHYPRPRWWRLHAGMGRLIQYATDDDQRQHHHAELHFQIWAIF